MAEESVVVLGFMESNLQSSPGKDDVGTKAAFRKPSNNVANRKYHRRSPVDGSSSPDGSPKRDGSSSPVIPREASEKVYAQKRRDGSTELDKDFGRSLYGKSGDSHRHADRQSSRGSHGHSRPDDYNRHDKYGDDEGKSHPKLSSRSNRESRDQNARYESKHGRSRDYSRHVDKYSRDKFDDVNYRNKNFEKETSHLELSKDKDLSTGRTVSGRKHSSLSSEDLERAQYRRDRDVHDAKKDYRRSSGDCKGDRSFPYEESRRHHLNDSASGRGFDGHRRKYDDWESKRDRNQQGKDHSKDKSVIESDNQEPTVKKSKFSSSADHGKDADEKQSSDSKKPQETAGQVQPNGSEAVKDLDAAKVAAMKAAELVNRNLVGTGFMSTEQKKKLLWGNKKSEAPKEAGHRWDTASFGDDDRREKFNKLMGVKGDVKAENKPDQQDAAKQMELQMDLEKQYTAGLRRRDGRTVGLGL